MEQNILFEKSAVYEVLHRLVKISHYNWVTYRYVNKGRYAIVKGLNKPNIAILLKGEPMYSFGKRFENEGEKGAGDSINVSALKSFIQDDVQNVYVLYRNGKLFSIKLQDFLRHSHKWEQKEGTLVRSASLDRYEEVST